MNRDYLDVCVGQILAVISKDYELGKILSKCPDKVLDSVKEDLAQLMERILEDN